MPPDENASDQLRFDILQTPIQVLLSVNQAGEIVEMAPNAAEWPPECRPMGLMVERLRSSLAKSITEAGEMRRLLRAIYDGAGPQPYTQDYAGNRLVIMQGPDFAALERIAKSLEAAGS